MTCPNCHSHNVAQYPDADFCYNCSLLFNQRPHPHPIYIETHTPMNYPPTYVFATDNHQYHLFCKQFKLIDGREVRRFIDPNRLKGLRGDISIITLPGAFEKYDLHYILPNIPAHNLTHQNISTSELLGEKPATIYLTDGTACRNQAIQGPSPALQAINEALHKTNTQASSEQAAQQVQQHLQEAQDEILDHLSKQDLANSLTEAWQIINTLNMNQSDQGESWPRANFWLRNHEHFKPTNKL